MTSSLPPALFLVLVSLCSCDSKTDPSPDATPEQDAASDTDDRESRVPRRIEPLAFDRPLPQTPIAWVNGDPVPAGELLKLIVTQNFSAGVNALVLAKVVDRELEQEGLTLDERAIDEEIDLLLKKTTSAQTIKQLAEGRISIKHLRRQARTELGWKKIFWRRQHVVESPAHSRPQYSPQTGRGYETRTRGDDPEPRPGLAAQVTCTATGMEMDITATEVLEFVLGLAKLGVLIEGRELLIDRTLVEQELVRAGAEVTERELQDWAAAQNAKYKPPFTWPQICRIKGTSPESETEQRRLILAYQRVVETQPSKPDVVRFFERNRSFFLGKTKKVRHILIRTSDETTELPLPDKEESAARQIQVLHRKLSEGLDFGWMAERYSDDVVTSRDKGRVAQPVKQWGGPLDPAFQKAAWALERIGEVSPPVKSRFGWHVIKLDEINEPADKEDIDWRDPRYWEWATDEYLTQRANAWLDALRAKAEIRRAPDKIVFDLKAR